MEISVFSECLDSGATKICLNLGQRFYTQQKLNPHYGYNFSAQKKLFLDEILGFHSNGNKATVSNRISFEETEDSK